MFDAWHEFCDVSIVRDQLKKNLKFWDDMDNKGLTTIEVSLEYFYLERIWLVQAIIRFTNRKFLTSKSFSWIELTVILMLVIPKMIWDGFQLFKFSFFNGFSKSSRLDGAL